MGERGTIAAKRVQEPCARGIQELPCLSTKDKYTRGCGDVETLLASVRQAASGRGLGHCHLPGAHVRQQQIPALAYIPARHPFNYIQAIAYQQTFLFPYPHANSKSMLGRLTSIAM